MSLPTSNEPSLEEILNSIRRIIAEDGPATAAASLTASGAWSARLEADEDVLVLTERVPMNGQPFLHADPLAPHSPPPQVAQPPRPENGPSGAMTDHAPVQPAFAAGPAQIELEPEAALIEAKPPQPMFTPEEAPMVAEDTEAQTVAALDMLDVAAHAEAPRAPSILMPAAGRTLEDVIRELMQPLIKDWLDEHLPALVQARVDEEIERISRRRVR